MKIERMAEFITKWRKVKFSEQRTDILELLLYRGNIPQIYDLYYEAVTDLKEDIYGNKVDEVAIEENGAYRFVCYDDLINFEI